MPNFKLHIQPMPIKKKDLISALELLKIEIQKPPGYGMCDASKYLYCEDIITLNQHIHISNLIKKGMRGKKTLYMFPIVDVESRINWIDEQIKLLTNNKKKS